MVGGLARCEATAAGAAGRWGVNAGRVNGTGKSKRKRKRKSQNTEATDVTDNAQISQQRSLPICVNSV